MKDAFFETTRPFGFAFAGAALDRVSAQRDDAGFVAGLRARPDARFALIARDMPILDRETRAPFWPLSLAQQLGPAQLEILLGRDRDGAPYFCAMLPDSAVELQADHSDGFLDRRVLALPGRPELEPVDLRTIALQGLVAPDEVAILGQAKAIAHWHARHSFCAACGAPSRVAAAGWRRECDACKTQHFPRTDPVVIMLCVDGERCLLGRQPRFPKGMYSSLAGFLEPGETIEEAVRREIHEESGIVCDEVRYVASQPWPFPASLMIGCLARAVTRDIVVDGEELEDARWFEREEVRAMFEKRHPQGIAAPNKMAIAHHLLKFWLHARGG
ncbi:MAG: NAD(+) diphosphatase [Pseudomonadota bacterium]|nr:NAD(+) diphosphatase [Pseudomonadota bacterium]